MTFCSKKMYIKTITFPCSDWGINFVVIKDFPFFYILNPRSIA